MSRRIMCRANASVFNNSNSFVTAALTGATLFGLADIAINGGIPRFNASER